MMEFQQFFNGFSYETEISYEYFLIRKQIAFFLGIGYSELPFNRGDGIMSLVKERNR